MIISYQQQRDMLSGWHEQDDVDVNITNRDFKELSDVLRKKSEEYQIKANNAAKGIFQMRFITATFGKRTYTFKQSFSNNNTKP